MIAAYTVATRMENILMIPILGVQNTMATFAVEYGRAAPRPRLQGWDRACWCRFP